MTTVSAPTRPVVPFALPAAAPAPQAWAHVLKLLCAWPSPEQLTFERRLVRVGAHRVAHLVLATSDGDGLLAGAGESMDELLAPLREVSALRATRHVPPVSARAVAVLPGLTSNLQERGLDGELLQWVARDIGAMAPGAGLGIVVWNSSAAPEDDPAVHTTVGHLPDGREVRIVSPPATRLHAAVRVWSPSTISPVLLARLRAGLGAEHADWLVAEDGDTVTRQVQRIIDGRPPEETVPTDEESTAAALSVNAIANVLGASSLTPQARGRARRIGRPFLGPVPQEGASVGKVFSPTGSMRALHIPWEQRQRHVFVCGRTGSGKSEMVARLAADDLRSGRGLLLIDPHGALADRVLGLVPPERRDQVVLIEPHHPSTAAIPALAPDGATDRQVAQIDDIYDELFDASKTWVGRWRRPAALALQLLDAAPGVDTTFIGLDQVLQNESARAGLVLGLTDDAFPRRQRLMGRTFEMRQLWDAGTNMGASFTTSAGRHALDHAPRWSLSEAIADGAIVIAKLDTGHLGSVDGGRLGRMLLRLAFGALAKLGPSSDHPDRPALSVIVDEAQLFAQGQALGAWLSQARKFGASLTLSSQTPSRLPAGLQADILTNCATSLVLQLPRKEAAVFADRDPLACEHIATLPRYHAVALLDTDDEPGEQPLVIHPGRPEPEDAAAAREVITGARERFGRTPAGARRGDLGRLAALADRYADLVPDRPQFGSHSTPTSPESLEEIREIQEELQREVMDR